MSYRPIQQYRGAESDLSQLMAGEIAVTTDTEKLFYGANGKNHAVSTITSKVLDYYVDSNAGNDNNNGLSPSDPFKTIQRALDALPHVINNNIGIHLADGTYNENILFQSRLGGAILSIIGTANAIIFGHLKVVAIIGIAFEPGTITVKASDGSDSAVHITSCTNVNLKGTVIDGNNFSNNGVYATNSTMTVNDYTIKNCGTAILGFNNSTIQSINCISSSNNGVGLSANASLIRKQGTQPTATTATATTNGGQIL